MKIRLVEFELFQQDGQTGVTKISSRFSQFWEHVFLKCLFSKPKEKQKFVHQGDDTRVSFAFSLSVLSCSRVINISLFLLAYLEFVCNKISARSTGGIDMFYLT
jgi:hypothetical protein